MHLCDKEPDKPGKHLTAPNTIARPGHGSSEVSGHACGHLKMHHGACNAVRTEHDTTSPEVLSNLGVYDYRSCM